MDPSLKVQLDIKNNAEDVQKYLMDLKNWEEEMKQKDLSLHSEKPSKMPPPRNKIKRSQVDKDPNSNDAEKKSKRISAYDYSLWDKFDVEKACSDLDNEKQGDNDAEDEETVNEENTDQVDQQEAKCQKKLNMIDEAFYEKELGNQFVKQEKWEEALQCYTKAIKLDSLNPIYYANRALCFIKIKNFKSAEVDSTVAIQIDKKYTKAYHRRAFARFSLGQLSEAKADYEEVLKLEPKNTLAKMEISKIERILSKDKSSVKKEAAAPLFNPKNMFDVKSEQTKEMSPKSSCAQKKLESTNANVNCQDSIVPLLKKENETIKHEIPKKEIREGDGDKARPQLPTAYSNKHFSEDIPEGCKIIQPILKAPHKRSKKPLRRIQIEDATNTSLSVNSVTSSIVEVVDTTNVRQIVPSEKETDAVAPEDVTLEVPKTAVRFQKYWNFVKSDPEKSYSYLKQIDGNDLATIFENSMESPLFGEILCCVADEIAKRDPELAFSFLFGLSAIKRFGTLVMFMSTKDKAAVRRCITKLQGVKSDSETENLRRLYEL